MEGGAFKKSAAGIDRLLKENMKVVINTTITPASLRSEGFKEILNFAKKRKILINTIFAAPSGAWANQGSSILFTKKEDVELYEQIVKDNPYVTRDSHAGYTDKACPAASESLYITPPNCICPSSPLIITF